MRRDAQTDMATVIPGLVRLTKLGSCSQRFVSCPPMGGRRENERKWERWTERGWRRAADRGLSWLWERRLALQRSPHTQTRPRGPGLVRWHYLSGRWCAPQRPRYERKWSDWLEPVLHLTGTKPWLAARYEVQGFFSRRTEASDAWINQIMFGKNSMNWIYKTDSCVSQIQLDKLC